MMRLLRACSALWVLSVNRLIWSISSVMLLFPICAFALFLLRIRFGEMSNVDQAFNRFSREFVLGMFSSFLIPIICLAYATSSIGRDREDRTLIYLLIRPIPRSCILLTKIAATLPVVLGMTLGCFFVYCFLAGDVGMKAFHLYLPMITYLVLAYAGLFQLFAVLFRHSTIIALVYALFMEFFVGNMPGIIKRIAVNFYGRSMMIELGKEHGVKFRFEELFVPVSAEVGGWTLLGITIGSILLAMICFEWKEYRDLT